MSDSVKSESKSPSCSSSSIKKSFIYTRTGDKGLTSLYNSVRLCKSEQFFNALGTVDELNSVLGIANEYALLENNSLSSLILTIQCILFDIGSCLATPKTSDSTAEQLKRVEFDIINIVNIEKLIDQYDSELPKLTHFILPSGGGLCSTHLHLARATARRAERETVDLVNKELVDNSVLVYLNRLSDLLFVLARYSAHKAGKNETIWKKATHKAINTIY